MENQNYDMNDFSEFDELRQQINELKEKVDQQGHLNEALVKKTIQGKMRKLHHNIFWYCLILGLIVPFIIWDFISSGLSWPFIIFSIVMFVGSFIAEYFINRMKIKDMGDDLVETARKLLQMKQNRKKQLVIGYCAVAIWIPWYFYEIYKAAASELDPGNLAAFVLIILIAIVAGGVLGLAIGLSFYRKLQRANDEMIAQINDITREQ